jgi:hypothetical protein
VVGDFDVTLRDHRSTGRQRGQGGRIAIGHDAHFQPIGRVLPGQEEHPLAGVGQVAAARHGQATCDDGLPGVRG